MNKGEKYLQLEKELQNYIKPLGEASDMIVDQGVSNYPIFVIHKQEVSIGIPIMDHKKINGEWSVNVTTIEEMVTKQVVKNEKVENFKSTFKSPDNYLCIFSLTELGADFLFIKRG